MDLLDLAVNPEPAAQSIIPGTSEGRGPLPVDHCQERAPIPSSLLSIYDYVNYSDYHCQTNDNKTPSPA